MHIEDERHRLYLYQDGQRQVSTARSWRELQAILTSTANLPAETAHANMTQRTRKMNDQLRQLEYNLESSGYTLTLPEPGAEPVVLDIRFLDIKHGEQRFRPIIKNAEDIERIGAEIQRRGWPWTPQKLERNILRCADCNSLTLCPFVDDQRDNAPICRDCYDREQKSNA